MFVTGEMSTNKERRDGERGSKCIAQGPKQRIYIIIT